MKDLIVAWALIVIGACLVAFENPHQLTGAILFFFGTAVVIGSREP